MAIFEGAVSIFERNGAVEIRAVSSGGYDATEVSDLVTDLVELKKPISKWSLWIDIEGHKPSETYTPTALQKLCKNNTVELIAVRRRGRNGQFRAPVLKITPVNAAPKATPNKARLGR
jgi:hypothetical protein